MTDFLKKWNKYFTFAALLSCFVNILQLTFSFYMFTIYRNVMISYSGFSLANITAAAFFSIMILGLFLYLRSGLLAMAGKNLNLALREKVYAFMVKASVIDSKRAYQGGVNDLEALHNYFASPAINALFDAPWAPFYLALIYFIHPVLGLVATLGALVVVGLSGLQEVLVRRSMKEANIINIKNFRFIDSFMRNAEVINGMGMISAIRDRFLKGNSRVMMNQTESSNAAAAIQAVIKPMQNLIQVMIYCTGAYYAVRHGFDVGLMVAASIIMGRGLAPLMQVVSSWRFTMQVKESYRKLKVFSSFIEQQQGLRMALPPPKGQIIVEGAVLKMDNRVLLKGVSFELRPGELLGLIGPSGAGKTTLCRLLLGIWPSMGGKVYLDGRDIFSWDKEEIGEYIGYLPQEIELFPGTVAENIARLGKIEAEHIEKVIEITGIKKMVDGFPKGLETRLEGDKGLKLSGGQKQRIGLARALYKNPRLLVLDEPTSNLDEEGETRLLTVLMNMKQDRNCTCIMVTHKPSLLQSMDKIMVLREGSIAMLGTKDEVFAKLAGAA